MSMTRHQTGGLLLVDTGHEDTGHHTDWLRARDWPVGGWGVSVSNKDLLQRVVSQDIPVIVREGFKNISSINSRSVLTDYFESMRKKNSISQAQINVIQIWMGWDIFVTFTEQLLAWPGRVETPAGETLLMIYYLAWLVWLAADLALHKALCPGQEALSALLYW